LLSSAWKMLAAGRTHRNTMNIPHKSAV